MGDDGIKWSAFAVSVALTLTGCGGSSEPAPTSVTPTTAPSGESSTTVNDLQAPNTYDVPTTDLDRRYDQLMPLPGPLKGTTTTPGETLPTDTTGTPD